MKEQKSLELTDLFKKRLNELWFNESNSSYFIHVGVTNSGKTHKCIERLKQSSSGVYLAPLRLLAWEIYDKLIEDGVPCNLITGEEKIIDPVILTKERKREIPIVGDPDEITLARVKAYYNSLATLIEKKSGLMAVPVINITHEGFGRAFVLVGKLIVVDKVLRDVHRWGFPSLEDMVEKSEQVIDKAVGLVEQYREVAEA